MQGVDALDLSGVHKRAPPSAHMANERVANGPEGGPDYTETNGAAWMPGFTCGGRSPKVEEGEEVVEPFGPEAEQEVSSRAGFTRMLMPGFTCGGRAGKVEGEVVEPFGSEAEEVSSRAGFTRMLSFWKLMGPMILRYKLVRKLPKGDVRDEELERLQGQSARWAECPSSAPAPPQGAWLLPGRLALGRQLRTVSREAAGPLGTQPLPRVLERAASAAVVCKVPAFKSRRGCTTSTRHWCSRTSWGCAGCT